MQGLCVLPCTACCFGNVFTILSSSECWSPLESSQNVTCNMLHQSYVNNHQFAAAREVQRSIVSKEMYLTQLYAAIPICVCVTPAAAV